MTTHPLSASIILTNYNYGVYLEEAIDSALDQVGAATEVIVVDDGSTDCSRDRIARYGRRVLPVFKENGGQASAFNAGFLRSRGEVVIFLDADDRLLPSALSSVLPFFADPDVVKVHWPLWMIDRQGRRTGGVKEPVLPDGDFRALVLDRGPLSEQVLPSAPTSGNAYARWFLNSVLPMPEPAYRLCADAYLFGLAPAFGPMRALAVPQGCYRSHGENGYQYTTLGEKIRIGVANHERLCHLLGERYRQQGQLFDLDAWRNSSWWPRIHRSMQEITTIIPPGQTFILADEDQWGAGPVLAGRPRVPFLERAGQYWGAPSNDTEAIRELERLRDGDAAWFVVAWPAFWWLDYYQGLHDYLTARYRCVLKNDRLVVFDLHAQPPAEA